MPDMTPVLGIRYPCSGDTIDSGVFLDFANDIQAALLAGDAAVALAANRPAASISTAVSPNQAVVINTATNLTFDTEVYDNDGMANLAVNNDRLTIQTGGLYLCGAACTSFSGFATLTSMAAILTVNGTTVYRRSLQPGDAGRGWGWMRRVLLNLNPGDILRAQTRWTGTGGPANVVLKALTAQLIATN
jgi:hypothetical protein